MSKNPKLNALLPTILALTLVAGMFIGLFIARSTTRSQIMSLAGTLGKSNKISTTLSLIDAKYIDKVSTDSLIEVLMPELMGELDPHSVYIPAPDMERTNETLEGEFEGIGVVFNMSSDTVIIINVISQGPSYKAGVQNGDRIITVGDSVIAGRNLPQQDVMKMLRGKRGTEVTVGVERQNIDGLVQIKIKRDRIPLKSIDAAFMIRPEIGFIKLTSFARNTHSELIEELGKLRAEGMTKLILDLRGNSGGFLDQAILIANEFLPEGNLIVYTVDRDGSRAQQFSNGKGRYQATETVILIDEGSASSSEILAGALQDNDKGTVIGRRSYGKGLVQQQIPFADGSAIRLTVSRYYTPTGRSIQKPYQKGDKSYGDDIYNRYLNNEMFSADSIKFADSLRYTTPGGKVVYGGGGIMPDIFVPMDTTDMTKYFIEVSGRNILYRYTMEYSDKHRAKLNGISTVTELGAFLDKDKNLLKDFIAYASKNGIAPDARQIKISEKLLTAQLRAYIGRNTPLQDSGFYSNIYVVDNAVLKALEVMEASQTKSDANR